ncbi:hypothetical protein DID73_00985 [Candidatus Marinamargulisbacteria bacterium SCGC AG-343-K17]|nr:hypothetical protein DID73_00985 [Candidatus Marinamargulisbacteria bacterium SCGC AG-343-K17]
MIWVGGIFLCLLLLFFLWFNGYRYFISNSVLRDSPSSYLQQHKNDLVAWRIWNKETLDYAKQVNKPLFISIGFATCYGCHVMGGESFRDPFISKIINRYFVPILVDRNQYPLIDSMYANLMDYQRGRTGWPATIMTTPDGIPLFMSTYVSRRRLTYSLNIIRTDWKEQSDVTQKRAHEWLDVYAKETAIQPYIPFIDPTEALQQFLLNSFDEEFAGIGVEQKFPLFLSWSQSLMISSDFLVYAKRTVDHIITSPLFDFIDGGVHRYSESRDWKRPHYEKLLIDQVYFIQLLTQIYALTNQQLYLDIAQFNMSFLISKFRNPSGYFVTGLDAGELYQSGSYYFFKDDFLDELAPLTFARFSMDRFDNLVSLINPTDFNFVDRLPLKNKRMNSRIQLRKDLFVSVLDNALLLNSIVYLNHFAKNVEYDGVIEQLLNFLLEQDPYQLPLMDLLVLYDVFKSMGLSHDLSIYELVIKRRLGKSFPFYKEISYLPSNLQQYDYLDLYNYPQPLFYVLKHRQTLLKDYTDKMMCNDLRQVLIKSWEQLSLLKIFNNSCQ